MEISSDGQIASSSGNEWAVKNVVQDVGEEMVALCANKDFNLLTVAGRAVMKVFALKNNEFEQVLDLKSRSRRQNLYFSGSISWNPVNENLIAATSSTGTIVLFDLEKCKNNNPEPIKFFDPETSSSGQSFRANKPAATKVCFHTYNPDLFISGTRDNIIYLHDIKVSKPTASFSMKGGSTDSIRDLQFCLDLNHKNCFVTGGDSGIVKFWDLRRPDKHIKELIGNTSSVGIALNPDLENWNLLATVGRDCFLRVWDWSAEKPKTLYSIETPTNIGRVEWSDKTNIATTTYVHDHQLLVWDYNRPFFPIMTFRGHELNTNISDMVFSQNADERKFVTCGKDRKLILHFTDYGDVTMENTVPISMACTPYNELVTTFPKDYTNGNTIAEFDYTKPVEPILIQHASESLPTFNDSDNLIKLARMYKFAGDNPVRICNYNAHVSKRLGNFSLAYTWKVIGILIQQADIYKPAASNQPNDAYFEYVDDSNKPKREKVEQQEEEDDLSESDDEINIESGAFCQNFQETLSFESDLFYNTDEFKMAGLPGGAKFLELIQQKQNTMMKTDFNLLNEEAVFTTEDSIDNDSNAGSDLDANSNESGHQHLSSGEEQDSSTSSKRSVSPALTTRSNIVENESVGSISSEIANWVDDSKMENYFSANLTSGTNNWGPLTILKRLINAYSDIGDSQTCATVCLVLGKLANQMFGEDQVNAWFFHYVEMLQDSGSNELATYITKLSGSEEVMKAITENMHVKFFCANCLTAAPSGKTSCPKCSITFATVCTVCDYEVKGLFSQCNSCGHGGHFEHLEEWFKTFGICAFPGCMHVCVEADKPEPVDQESKKLLPCGQNLFTDTDDLKYYRDEDGTFKRLPELSVESATQKKRKANKYSLNP